ncbi:MAG: hypothetical protein ACPG5B_02645 [Chitinophagales bacterium]
MFKVNEMQTNEIIELYKGHYLVILDFPTALDLKHIIEPNYKFVWCVEHHENTNNWSSFEHTLYNMKADAQTLYVRNIEMEYIMDTASFLNLLPHIRQTVKIIQTNMMPPYFMDLKRLKEKGKYDLLREKLDYLFEIEIVGATDYARLISPDKQFLERVIAALKQ